MTITICYIIEKNGEEFEYTEEWFSETIPLPGDKIILQNCLWRVGGRTWIKSDKVELSITLISRG